MRGGALTHSRGHPCRTTSSRSLRRRRRASAPQSALVQGTGGVGVRRARYWVIWWVVIAGGWSSVSRAPAMRSEAAQAGRGSRAREASVSNRRICGCVA